MWTKGMIMVTVGIGGLVLTIIWIIVLLIISNKRSKQQNIELKYETDKFNDEDIRNKINDVESTVLLEDKESDSTVLLEDEDSTELL